MQNAFIDLITDSRHGHTNPLLLPPEQFRQQANMIQAHGVDSYTMMSISTRATKEMLIFDVKLPLINNQGFQIFKDFKLHALPVDANGKNVKLIPSTEYSMVNMNLRSALWNNKA